MNVRNITYGIAKGFLCMVLCTVFVMSHGVADASVNITIVPATGGEEISADSVGGAYTVLTGPVVRESAAGDLVLGSIAVLPPDGFSFDPNASVVVVANSGTDIVFNQPVVHSDIIWLNISGVSSVVPAELTFSGIAVRPIAADPLASGSLSMIGDSVGGGPIPSGDLQEVAGVGARGGASDSGPKETPVLSISNPSLTYTASPQNVVVEGSVEGVVSNIRYDGSATAPTNVGEYAITADFTPVDTNRYANLADVSVGTFSITQATATIFTAGYSGMYDGMPHNIQVLSARGAGGEDLSNFIDIGVAYRDVVNVSRHWNFSNPNYYNVAGDDSIQIAPRPVTITATYESKPYDGNIFASAIPHITAGSLAPGDTAEFTESYGDADVGLGTKTLTPVGHITDGVEGADYVVTLVPLATGTILPKTLAIRGLTASGRVYDGSILAEIFGTPWLDGVITGDDVRLTGEPVGSFVDAGAAEGKTVTIGGLALEGSGILNYELADVSAVATITPRPLVVTADSHTKMAGASDPLSFGYTHDALADGDTDAVFFGQLARAQGEGVGSYAITQGSLTPGTNYDMRFVDGSLAIMADPLVYAMNLATSTDADSGLADATIPLPMSLSTTTSVGMVGVEIPAGIRIHGPAGWNGILALPTATTSYTLVANPGTTASASEAIEIGAGETPLTFDVPVKITFIGQAGKLVGWSRGDAFHQITSICNSVTSPVLTPGSDCKIDNGSDVIVWTRHFSTFITYTESAIPVVATSQGGGGGGGGNGPIGVVAVPPILSSSTTVPVLVPPVVSKAVGAVSGGQVLGASAYHFTKSLKRGSVGQDVVELQKMLISQKLLKLSAPTGAFGSATEIALKAYQKTHGIQAVGVVGAKTRALLNKGSVQVAAAATAAQLNTLAQLEQRLRDALKKLSALSTSTRATR